MALPPAADGAGAEPSAAAAEEQRRRQEHLAATGNPSPGEDACRCRRNLPAHIQLLPAGLPSSGPAPDLHCPSSPAPPPLPSPACPQSCHLASPCWPLPGPTSLWPALPPPTSSPRGSRRGPWATGSPPTAPPTPPSSGPKLANMAGTAPPISLIQLFSNPVYLVASPVRHML